MIRPRFRLAPWVVAAALGAAARSYWARVVPTDHWGGARPGVWDATAAVVSEPRFLVVVCFTGALIRSVLRRDPVPGELIRRGSWRRHLGGEAAAAVRALVPSAVVVLGVCLTTAAVTGLPGSTLATPGSATGVFADANLPAPVGVLAQVALTITALTVVHLVLTALRLLTGSVVPVIVAAMLLFCWSGASVLALSTTITTVAGRAPAFSEGLDASAVAGLNLITYLQLPAALAAGLPVVEVGLAVAIALAVGAAIALDLRVARRRAPAAALLQRTP